MNDDAAPVVHVGMGCHAVARGPTVLKATLGSCVGIALIWRAQGLCGLAHCLLPQSPESCTEPGARYVDQAVRTLLDDLQVPRHKRSELAAHLCGGAHMSAGNLPTAQHLQVGRRNIEAAHLALAREQLTLHSAELGGRCARRFIVDAADGSVTLLQVADARAGLGLLP